MLMFCYELHQPHHFLECLTVMLNIALGGLQAAMACQILHVPQGAADAADFPGGVGYEGSAA